MINYNLLLVFECKILLPIIKDVLLQISITLIILYDANYIITNSYKIIINKILTSSSQDCPHNVYKDDLFLIGQYRVCFDPPFPKVVIKLHI